MQQKPQPSEDEAEVVANGGEGHVTGIAGAALEMTVAEVPVGFHLTDYGLDRGANHEVASSFETLALLAIKRCALYAELLRTRDRAGYDAIVFGLNRI